MNELPFPDPYRNLFLLRERLETYLKGKTLKFEVTKTLEEWMGIRVLIWQHLGGLREELFDYGEALHTELAETLGKMPLTVSFTDEQRQFIDSLLRGNDWRKDG